MQALLLVDHGSRRATANASLGEVARGLAERLGPATIVQHAHMELAPPTIAEGVAACVAAGATALTVVPYFLFAGRHVQEDVPRLVAEAAASHPGLTHRITAPVGLHPLMLDVVAELASE